MSVSVLEALQNAELNLENVKKLGIRLLPLVESQLHNGVALLEKGYGLDEQVEPLLEKYGKVENVPDRISGS